MLIERFDCSCYQINLLRNSLSSSLRHLTQWRAVAFAPLLTSSPLTKIGIIYTQVLQEEKILPVIPSSEWLISSMEPEICMKMLRNLTEKPGAKFPATTLNYSVVKIVHLDDAFSEFFEPEASPVEGQSLQQKDKKRRKRKDPKKKKIEKTPKPKDVGHFLSKFWFLRMLEQQ